jgi:hypothetical protein
MSGPDHEPSVRRKPLLVLKVLETVILVANPGGRFPIHPGHLQEIGERGLCPGSGHSYAMCGNSTSQL